MSRKRNEGPPPPPTTPQEALPPTELFITSKEPPKPEGGWVSATPRWWTPTVVGESVVGRFQALSNVPHPDRLDEPRDVVRMRADDGRNLVISGKAVTSAVRGAAIVFGERIRLVYHGTKKVHGGYTYRDIELFVSTTPEELPPTPKWLKQ